MKSSEVVLLDVNLLIALAWPTHVSHERALRWFERRAGQSWATCPLTELAFVRIVSNPAFSPHALTVAEAANILSASLADPVHVFWPDDLPMNNALALAAESLQGHKQLTDAYLLGLARNRKGKLATLDKAVASWARERDWVEVV
jgi:toxin-antitoxin system PIN domain toxin